MKRIIPLLFFALIVMPSFGQDAPTPTGLNYDVIKKKLEKSDEDIKDEKKNIKPSTWITRGKIFLDAMEVNAQFLRFGMGGTELKLMMKDPLEVKIEETDQGAREVYIYDRIEVYVENQKVSGWKETKQMHENAAAEALKSFKKAVELDEKGNVEKKIKPNLEKLKRLCESYGAIIYNNKDYEDALKLFDVHIEAGAMSVFEGAVDTAIVYFAGLAAYNMKDFDAAIKYFKKATEYGYEGGNTYALLSSACKENGDTARSVEVLKEGFQKYPDNNQVLIELINYYLMAGQSEEALKFISLARENDPDNVSFYFAEGTLYEKMGEIDKAYEAYNKAIELDPGYFNAYYNIGVLYYNNAVKLFEKANEIMDNTEFAKAKAEAEDELRKAVPYMEKAHEIDPDEVSTMETLKTLYYRLKIDDKLEAITKELNEKTGN